MNKERAVGIAALLVVLVLAYTAYVSHDSLKEFHASNRELILFHRKPSPVPGFLTASSPVARPTPVPSASAARTVEKTTSEIKVDFSSTCAFYHSVGATSVTQMSPEVHRQIRDFLEETWPHDDSLELFDALSRGDVESLRELARTSRLPAAEEIGLLDRLHLLEGSNSDSFLQHAEESSSSEPGDLDAVAEMKARDPDNSFWPIIEADILKRQGRESERIAVLAEAAALPTYRNPVSSFNAQIKRTALEQGNDAEMIGVQILLSSTPIAAVRLTKSLEGDVGKSAEIDESLRWIGKTMELSQFPDSPFSSGSSASNGVDGDFFDAFSGVRLAQKANGDKSTSRSTFEKLRTRFRLSDPSFEDGFDDKNCDNDAIHAHFEKMRQRLKLAQ